MKSIKKKALLMSVLMVAMSLAACNNGGNSVSSKKGGKSGGGSIAASDSEAVNDSSKKKSSSGFIFSSVEQQDLPKYEVKIDYDDGTDPTVSEIECGQKLSKPNDPTVPSGKKFYGWMNVKNGGQIWNFESDDLNMVMEDIELKPLFVDASLEAQPFEAELCPAITESLGKKDGEMGMDGETYSGGQKGKGLIARAYKDDATGEREWGTSGDYYRDEDGIAHYATAADKADPDKNVFGGLVHYFYVKGNALIWELQSDVAAENVALFMRLSGEYGLDEQYQVRQGEGENRVTESFSDTSFPVKVNGTAQQYGAITIHNIEPKTFIDFQDFYVGNVNLVAGKNTIELLVDNNDSLNGTITSSAPVIDCIKLYSSSTLTWPTAKLSQMDKDIDQVANMGIVKKLLRPRVIVWAATTVVLSTVLIVANYFATQRYSSLLDGVFGRGAPIIAEGEVGVPVEQDFDTKEDAFNNANEVTKKICEEGMILLKNRDKALPLKEGAKVSVFGKNSVNLVYGGSGSAAPGKSNDEKINEKYGWRRTIFDSLEAAGMSYNPELKSFYEDKSSGDGRSANPAMEHGEGIPVLKTGETAYSDYPSNVKSSYDQYGDAALVVFSRIAGENWDLPRQAADNNTRHYLELDNNERELLRQIAASGKFQHIIILLNGSNYIDLGFLEERTNPTDYNDFGKYIDACINIGSPGANGIMALGEILSGEINPSGHSVDTIYTNYKNDPTWQNFGGNKTYDNPSGTDNYTKADGSSTKYYLVEYEENIYMGYRYYETRGAIEGEDWYNKNVVYPFGYGLSYTTFSEEVLNVSTLEGKALKYGEAFEVSIKVKNTGDAPGKQVVQLYASAPYNNGGIEKAHKVLVGFAKTDLLQPGKDETVKITVDPYDFASFDSRDKNSNGFKGYELEAGDYKFYAGTDAHNSFGTFTKHLAEGVKIENDPDTGTKVEPLYPEVTAHMNEAELLSRSNFTGTFPKMITAEERKANDDTLAALRNKKSDNDLEFKEMPTFGADFTVELKELAGKPYDDELWDEFLDQLTFDECLKLFNEGCYSTASIQRKVTITTVDEETGEEYTEEVDKVLVPSTTSADGPTGIVGFLGDPAIYGCCYYQSECLLAQTYNVDLALDQAHAIGNECLVGDEKGTTLPYPGWYAPGVNLHRSPFSGRNTEYYSEDPFLNGRFAGVVIKGVGEKGVYANVKHFAVNDQETHRSANGIATWLDEQALRELYLKPFEMAVKEGEAKGLMTSFNRIGTEWAGGSYRLVTKILRNEWGFRGSVICDFHTDFYMDSKQMLYAGGDLNLVSDAEQKLITSNKYDTPYVSPDDIKDANLIRNSAHNNLYAIANSCALKVAILGYKTAGWKVALYVADGVIPAGLVTWGFFAIFTALRRKEAAAVATAE